MLHLIFIYATKRCLRYLRSFEENTIRVVCFQQRCLYLSTNEIICRYKVSLNLTLLTIQRTILRQYNMAYNHFQIFIIRNNHT